jgi:N-acetylglutamate synthase-like GNAT family acetyltransferase
MVAIETLRAEQIAACVRIMRQLPAWFGVEQAIENYTADLRTCDGFVAIAESVVVGFVGLKRYGSDAMELNVIGVLPEYRRKGIGSRLLRAVEAEARNSGVRFLHTKTLSPAKPNSAYEESRAFWRAAGFVPLDEHLLWGPTNPCLVLLKALRDGR